MTIDMPMLGLHKMLPKKAKGELMSSFLVQIIFQAALVTLTLSCKHQGDSSGVKDVGPTSGKRAPQLLFADGANAYTMRSGGYWMYSKEGSDKIPYFKAIVSHPKTHSMLHCNRMCGTDKSTTNFICYGNGFEISVTGPNLNQLKAELKIAKEGKAISMDSVARGGVQLNDSMIDGSNQFWNYRPYNPNYPVNAPGQPEQYSQGGVTVTRMPADKWGDDVWKVEGRGEAYYQATTYGNAILPCNQRGIEGSYPQ